jgi:sulfite reductase (NADPH) flavoprotein alpha-component|tara:strand:+ start:37 stop:492 length:456 start_codon:yes stop_codon:yes gene_type:complete
MNENEILIIFGTETGNAEELSEVAAKMASDHDLIGNVMDMDDVTTDILLKTKKLMVICSTWGDGEQPVNAEDLYESTNELNEGALSELYFSVLALGDTAFDLFCESGKEWDNVLDEKGASRVIDRIDCDTDYDDDAEDWIGRAFENFKKLI